MATAFRQACHNTVARYQARSVTATFDAPTVEKNLVVVIATCAGGFHFAPLSMVGPPGFTLIRDVGDDGGDLRMWVWYYEGAPAMNSVTVTVSADRSLQVRAMEFTGVAQTGSLDKVSVRVGDGQQAYTGPTGTTSQADELVVACIVSESGSFEHSGFSGGLTRFFYTASPQSWGQWNQNADGDRNRMSVHLRVVSSTGSFGLYGSISCGVDWIAFICTFKGGTSGPKKMTSKLSPPSPPALVSGTGTGALTAFGPLRSLTSATTALTQGPGTGRIFPFDYQYLFNGVLTSGAPQVDPQVFYRVLSHEGLYGYGVRTSDDDQPRGDGSLRGIDLQSARQMVFEIEITDTPDGIERDLDTLYRALVPQRDVDWDLLWRHPGQGCRLVRCRPVELPRTVDRDGTIRAPQAISLRAADPRHYSAVEHTAVVATSPVGSPLWVTTNVTNAGNIPAYPVITITGPLTGPPVTRIQLVNETALVTFDVQLTLQSGSVLVGDMAARVTGAPVPTITLDGQSKYGSWQLPRDPFRLEADPLGQGGYNVLHIVTIPEGAPITCTLRYRDSWSG